MARSRIEGVFIELGADASGIKDALKDVNSSLRDTQSQLKDVNKLLKLDPSNTELLSQKQRLLGDAISQTESKLQALKQANEKAKVALEKGELGQDKYDALQREIIRTEDSLEKLKTQASRTNTAMKNSTSGLDKMGNAAEKASSKLSSISKGAGALAGGVVALIPATEELNRDLSFLEQNAKNAGVGMNVTEAAFKTFNAVSGETDSSVEGVSNLLQAGFTESNLQKAVEGVAGAMSRFPDTLKVESLSDSIQETVATGKSIGQFSEYLDRAGIGAENFDKELAKCKTTSEKTDLALQALVDGGASDAYDAWEKNNKGLKEYEDATIEMQTALAELGKELMPVAAEVINFAKDGVKWFNNLPDPVKKAAGAATLLAAASSPVLKGFAGITSAIPKLTKGLGSVNTASKTASVGSKLLNGSLLINPYVLAAGAAAGLGVAIYKVVQAQNEETIAAKKAVEQRDNNVKSIENEYQRAEIQLEKLRELEAVEDKTVGQKEQMKAIVDDLNKSVDGLNIEYDKENDKLSKNTDEIGKNIEKRKESALADQYIKNAKAAMDDYIESLTDMEQKEIELQEAIKNRDQYSEGGGAWNNANRDVKNLRGELEDTKGAITEFWQEANKNQYQTSVISGEWDKLAEEAKAKGLKIPQSLITGMKEGQYQVPTTVDQMTALINFQNAADKAGNDGWKIVQELKGKMDTGKIDVIEANKRLNGVIKFNEAAKKAGQGGTTLTKELANKIKTGKITVDEAIKQMNKSADSKTKNGMKAAGKGGKNLPDEAAKGIKSGKGKTDKAASDNAKSARTSFSKVSTRQTGKNWADGFRKGIVDKIGSVARAAADLARKALNAAKKESETNSPSKRWEKELGLMDGAGYERGLLKSIPKVEKAGRAVEKAGFIGAKNSASIINNPMQCGTIKNNAVMPKVLKMNQDESQNKQAPINQTINIYQPVETPAETARAIKNQATYGLAGATGR